MDLIRNFKLHLMALVVIVIAEWIGVQRFGLVVLLPLLYALVLGTILSFPRFHLVSSEQMDRAVAF